MTNPVTAPTTEQIAAWNHQIDASIERLRALSQLVIQSQWHICCEDLPETKALQTDNWQQWPIAELNDRTHIAWPAGLQTIWLAQQWQVPQALDCYPLNDLQIRLALTWWADSAQIDVDGEFVQAGDLFDCRTRILLRETATVGDTIAIALRLVSPGHDAGALVESQLCFETSSVADPEPSFVADELASLQGHLTSFWPEKLADLATAISALDWSAVRERQAFTSELNRLRQQIQPLAGWLKQRQINLLGHSHIDMAWLWPVSETWEVAERTFQSVLQLQRQFPHLTFCHTTAALYEWLENYRPALFAAIQQNIAAGTWEVLAGLWVEPEFNTVSGESIARQVLYGQRYAQEKFGKPCTVAWLPDSFGFCWQLPQILKQGGIQYFVTEKLRWNDTTQFPYGAFRWRGPDGSEIFSVTLPPIGQDTNPLKMSNYAKEWEAKTGLASALWLPGMGDHGGGPTRDMLEVAERWQQSDCFPQIHLTHAESYLRETEQQLLALQASSNASTHSVPVWNDELYLEFHRGCYTSHADQKLWNRRCERGLYQAELFASLATLEAGVPYPKTALETAWKQMLFNQFHDILPGSAIPEVFVDANQAWEASASTAEQILTESLAAIAAQIALPEPPYPNSQAFAIFNPLNWSRSEVVEIPLPQLASNESSDSGIWQAYDTAGHLLPSQLKVPEVGEPPILLVWVANIHAIGYCTIWLHRQPTTQSIPKDWHSEDFVLDNQRLRVTVDPQTGNLSSVFDKQQQREILSRPGNQLQAWDDRGQYWDAWNIDPHYAKHPLPPAQLVALQWRDRGPVRTSLRVIRQIGQSTFQQDYTLDHQSPCLKIGTVVDWQERHVLVKAAFPLTVEADFASYEIPYGTIQRTTRPQTDRDRAKWEVPALQWADLSDAQSGISLLNDCKYGYDSQPSQLRLTLLRGSEWPDPDADKGWHTFTYALYPHAGSWQAAKTVHHAYQLNLPLLVVPRSQSTAEIPSPLPAAHQFLHLNSPHAILSAFKQCETDPNQWIVRCYECHGEKTQMTDASQDPTIALSHTQYPWANVQVVNLLEQPQPVSADRQFSSLNQLAPWQVKSCAIGIPSDNA